MAEISDQSINSSRLRGCNCYVINIDEEITVNVTMMKDKKRWIGLRCKETKIEQSRGELSKLG